MLKVVWMIIISVSSLILFFCQKIFIFIHHPYHQYYSLSDNDRLAIKLTEKKIKVNNSLPRFSFKLRYNHHQGGLIGSEVNSQKKTNSNVNDHYG